MFKKRSSKQAAVVGLDLDPGHLAVGEVIVNGSVTLTRGAVAPLRPGVLRDGEVADVPALTEALKALWAEHDLPRNVRLGIANQRIVVRTLDLPPLDDPKALAAAVKVQAPDHIPMPMEEAVLDWQSLGEVETPAGPRNRVVVVAVRREVGRPARRRGRRRRSHARGHRPLGVRHGPCAAASGRQRRHALRQRRRAHQRRRRQRARLPLHARRGRWPRRDRPHAGRAPRADRSSTARQWLGHVGLVTPIEDVEGEAELVGAARAALDEGVHQLADTVRNSLNFYRMQESAENVENGIVTGSVVSIPGFVEALSEQLRLPLEAGVVGSSDPDADLGRLTVAAGLAVEQVRLTT